MQISELENWHEISENLKGGTDSVQMAIGKAMQNVTLALVKVQAAIRGPLVRVANGAEKLNENINNASVTSEKLTKAIKNATWAGAIIAGFGVFIAGAALFWDIYKTLWLN